MMKSAILVDSTSTLTDELLNNPDIYQVNLQVTSPDGTVFTDTSDKSNIIEFYNKLQSSDDLPTTSQPEPGQFIEQLTKIKEQGYDQVFFIHLSKELSGTMQTAQMMAKEFEDDFDSCFIDSQSTSVIMKELVEKCLVLLEKGYDADTIVEKLNWVAEETKVFVAIENLENLIKGGRLSRTSGMIGNLLKIKPILLLDKTVEVYEKVRTSKRMIKRMRELIDEEYERFNGDCDFFFAHGNVEDEILDLMNQVKEKYPEQKYYQDLLTPILGTHGGTGCKGIAVIPHIKLD